MSNVIDAPRVTVPPIEKIQEQTQEIEPPNFPRYFRPRVSMRRNDNLLPVLVWRHDDPGCAIYYEGGQWAPCDCGHCTLMSTLLHCVLGNASEISAAEALLIVGGGL